MRPEVRINGAICKLLPGTFRMNQQLGRRVSTAVLDIEGEDFSMSTKDKVTRPTSTTTWLAGWPKRTAITIDKDVIDSTLTWFPVMLRLSGICGISGRDMSRVFAELHGNYRKLAVTTDDGTTQLYVEVEKWDEDEEEAILWISKTGWSLSASADTTVYLYWDATHADNASYVGIVGSTPGRSVWDSNFALVDHMQDNPDTMHTKDSTSNENDGTKSGANEPRQTNRNVLSFNAAASSYVTAGEIYNSQAKFWLSVWFKPEASQLDYANIFGKSLAPLYMSLYISGGTLYFYRASGGGTVFNLALGSVNSGQWNHAVVSISNTAGARGRLNGATALTDVDTSPLAAGGDLCFGTQLISDGWKYKGLIANIIVGTDDLTAGEETGLYNGIIPSDATDIWYIDEGTGTAIASYGTAGNSGTAGTACAWSELDDEYPPVRYDGLSGYGQQFDGVDDYVNYGADSSLEMSTGCTQEYFLKVLKDGVDTRITARDQAWSSVWRSYSGGYLPEFHIDGTWRNCGTWKALTVGQYYHLGGSYSESTRHVIGYSDGVSFGDNELSGLGTYSITGGAGYAIVGAWAGLNYCVAACMDEVRISNTARSAAYFKATNAALRDNLLDFGTTEEFYTEEITSPSMAIIPAPAFGGYTKPTGGLSLAIDRGPTPFISCAIIPAPAAGGSATYLNNYFGGYVAQRQTSIQGFRRYYRIDGQDYNVRTKRKLVTESYAAKTNKEIVADLFSTYLPEFNTDDVEDTVGTITINWTRQPLNKCLDALAAIFGMVWYIDYAGAVQMFTPDDGTAPFELSDTPFGTKYVGYQNLQHVHDFANPVKKVTVVGDGVVEVRTKGDADDDDFESKHVDKNIDALQWAQDVGDAIIAVSGGEKQSGSLRLMQEGLQLGQRFRLTNSARDIAGYYTVQSITLKMSGALQEIVELTYGDRTESMTDIIDRIQRLEEQE